MRKKNEFTSESLKRKALWVFTLGTGFCVVAAWDINRLSWLNWAFCCGFTGPLIIFPIKLAFDMLALNWNMLFVFWGILWALELEVIFWLFEVVPLPYKARIESLSIFLLLELFWVWLRSRSPIKCPKSLADVVVEGVAVVGTVEDEICGLVDTGNGSLIEKKFVFESSIKSDVFDTSLVSGNKLAAFAST